MVGVIVLAVAFVLFVPVVVTSLGVLGAVLGALLKSDAEARYEGSELIELNR